MTQSSPGLVYVILQRPQMEPARYIQRLFCYTCLLCFGTLTFFLESFFSWFNYVFTSSIVFVGNMHAMNGEAMPVLLSDSNLKGSQILSIIRQILSLDW